MENNFSNLEEVDRVGVSQILMLQLKMCHFPYKNDYIGAA